MTDTLERKPGAGTQIAAKASFARIRYAQVWEDADVLLKALDTGPGKTFVSICSAGDNALALLTLDPARVVAVDLSTAQLSCLRLRMAAYASLDHEEFLALMGARPSNDRAALLERLMAHLDETDRAFWRARARAVARFGAGGIGKFENYFRIMRVWLLPLVHSARTVNDVFVSRPPRERTRFLDERWNNRRWKLLLKTFFSNRVMGLLGRDPAFFDHVEDSLAAHVARRIRHAAVELDPAENPYLHWILKGHHGKALPLAWRAEHFSRIRERLDRVEIRQGPLESFTASGEKADGFNLSDIFEYMDEEAAANALEGIARACRPGARLAWWNMMAPRHVPPALSSRLKRLPDLEEACKRMDKAFFYSDFIVAEAQ